MTLALILSFIASEWLVHSRQKFFGGNKGHTMHRGTTTVICLALLCLAACLKANDEFEIVDSTLGQDTPTPTATNSAKPKPTALVTATLSGMIPSKLLDSENFDALPRFDEEQEGEFMETTPPNP
jgi:hypothetical protein